MHYCTVLYSSHISVSSVVHYLYSTVLCCTMLHCTVLTQFCVGGKYGLGGPRCAELCWSGRGGEAGGGGRLGQVAGQVPLNTGPPTHCARGRVVRTITSGECSQ